MTYNHKDIEKKWQGIWEKEKISDTPKKTGKNKKYILDMFPYPSAASMHIGHLEGYIGTDILARYHRMKGYPVLHPIGWDAFGLPAENYAIKTGIHPDKSTHGNIKVFKRQLKSAGLSYDWDREIDTSNPEFYKWTQWLFILIFKKGLAYKSKAPVNWCPSCETVLANEQVINGRCERCDTQVVEKELDQWFLKITDYADRLIEGLKDIDWPQDVKVQQVNWIGRSEGRIIEFKEEASGKTIKVFTTRPETLNSATYIAIASKKDKFTKEKKGRFTGKYAINPLNNKKLPIWETNYVDPTYGTGSIMGVPAYDERDMEFAKEYGIDIVKERFTKKLLGEKQVNYHLRDWLISRQRYWGCPIPMIFCQECGWQPVPESKLPVLLPKDVDFLPKGKSPIARSKVFQKKVTCPNCGNPAEREVDTMDTYVDSSWYFIRFVDPKNKKEFANERCIENWLPVDIYVGGGHVVQHLLFARFFWKVLYDEGLINKSKGDEPFLKLRAPGWILGADSRKMSKRWNNVVTPDDIIPKFGADTLRVYEMFMGPFDVMKPWSIAGVEGASRFLRKIWDLYQANLASPRLQGIDQKSILVKMHQTIKKVTEDIEKFHYNTAISAIMEYVNELREKAVDSGQWTVESGKKNRTPSTEHRTQSVWDKALMVLAKLLAPFAPHMAEEVWVNILGQKFSIHKTSWPKYDPLLVKEEFVTIAVQVDGKLRTTIRLKTEYARQKTQVVEAAKSEAKVKKWLIGKEIRKSVIIPGRLVNFVTK
jgi:leucyl-tRNA synthetase